MNKEKGETSREEPKRKPPLLARTPETELERQAKELEQAVYGKPLIVHYEPSIGTNDTPPATDEVLPIHPGGITKQGDDEEIGASGPAHLPRVIRPPEKKGSQ